MCINNLFAAELDMVEQAYGQLAYPIEPCLGPIIAQQPEPKRANYAELTMLKAVLRVL